MRRLLTLFAITGLVAFQALPAFAADGDGDLVEDEVDVCPDAADPFQGDLDGDGVGDLCESNGDGASTFDGTPANDLVVGTDSDDTLAGAGADDALYGKDGDDTLDGGDGLDFLVGGLGADTLTGGASCDVFAFNPSNDEDTITDFDPDADRLMFPPQDEDPSDDVAPVPTFGGDDHLVVTFGDEGSPTATLQLQGLPAGVAIVLNNQPCETTPPFICAPLFEEEPIPAEIFDITFPFDGIELFGTSANETLNGTRCSDIIVGDVELHLDGADGPLDEPLCGNDGHCSDDVINGRDGNDLVFGDKAYLTTGEFAGDDTIKGGDGDDLLVGDSVYLDDCTCGPFGYVGPGLAVGPVGGNDTLYGEGGNDLLFGDAVEGMVGYVYGGHDYLDGGDGKDFIVGDGIFIVEEAEAGNDTLIGGAGDDELYGDSVEAIDEDAFGGDDHLDGGDGDDILVGDGAFIGAGSRAGNDTLIGGAGDDELYGDADFAIEGMSIAGEDMLTGGAGDDLLFGDAPNVDGDAENDTFVYDTTSNFGDDTIGDLGTGEVVDTILFTGITFSDLEDRTLWADDFLDLVATVYTTSGHVTPVGSIRMVGPGVIGGVSSWTDLMAGWPVDVVAVP